MKVRLSMIPNQKIENSDMSEFRSDWPKRFAQSELAVTHHHLRAGTRFGLIALMA